MPRPSHGRSRRHRIHASFELMEPRQLLTNFTVTTTANDGTGSLRAAITASNMPHAGTDTINFAIPASTSPELDVPVPGFNPSNQTWTISLTSPLPPIEHQVIIDGFTQAEFPVPYRYPAEAGPQVLSILGDPTGGTFTLTTSAPLPVRTTAPIPFNANSAQVLAALNAILGAGNVFVSGGPSLPGNSINISFIGQYDGDTVPPLTADSSMLTGGLTPAASIAAGLPSAPSEITSAPNTYIGPATQGNNATPRLIINGSMTGGATGFVVDSSDSILRGLVIDGFGVGVSVPSPSDVGDLIQGNDFGLYPILPVDPATGFPLVDAPPLDVTGLGNSLDAVRLESTNATVGGVEKQDENVIIGNGGAGVWIMPGGHGNQILGNQIGVLGVRNLDGPYVIVPNGGDGVLIDDSSNYVGGPAAGAGNLISGNLGDGVHIVGPAATRNNVMGNYIGVGPGGGFSFGGDNPGNIGDGVTIENASDNDIGGTTAADRNVISGNQGSGVRIFGLSGERNLVQGNYIGLTSDGVSALGNSQEGVSVSSADNVVGPMNVISANLQGVLLSGIGASGNLVQANLIGTDSTGTADLGNAEEGVLIDGAPSNTVTGNAKGSQVISGNNVGVHIVGVSATGNQVLGSFIGTDVTGTLDLGNSQEGVLIEGAPGNTIGGTTATGRNLISSNHVGVELTGSQSQGNVVQGNAIGTGIAGTELLGNELDGVFIHDAASNNLIGGTSASAGNSIAFNRRDGVHIQDASVHNSILTNAIFDNLGLGINLIPPANSPYVPPTSIPTPPVLSTVATSIGSTIISGSLIGSAPNTLFTIQFFFSSPLDPTGQNEGGLFVGQTTAMTGSNGSSGPFSVNVPSLLTSGQLVTATATDSSGNTSEFSGPITEIFGTVQFQMANYTVSEAAGTATIEVTRSGGSGGLFTVNYSTVDMGGGSADAGSDYVSTSGTLTFNPGVNTQTFTIPIIDDGLPDADETVFLMLGNHTGPINIGTQGMAVLTILGNQPGTIQFSMSNYAVDEAAGTATITVTRNESGPTSSVNYSTADGTAVAGTDYVPTSGTLTFNPGVLVQTFTIPILINPQINGNKTVLLSLSPPTGLATSGSPSSAVLTIIDDGVDRMGPHVTSVKAVSGAFGVAELVITFDEALNPATAVDLLNYGYAVRTAGKDGKLGTKDDHLIGLCPATYNPTTFTVTIPLGTAVSSQTKLLLMINEATDVPGEGVGVSDLLGNLLDGNDDGFPGGPFSAVVVAKPAQKPVHQTVAKTSVHKAKPAKHPVEVAKTKAHPKGPSTGKAGTSNHHR
jgi:Calx-beta domain